VCVYSLAINRRAQIEKEDDRIINEEQTMQKHLSNIKEATE
jgi:hypothetical protein